MSDSLSRRSMLRGFSAAAITATMPAKAASAADARFSDPSMFSLAPPHRPMFVEAPPRLWAINGDMNDPVGRRDDATAALRPIGHGATAFKETPPQASVSAPAVHDAAAVRARRLAARPPNFVMYAADGSVIEASREKERRHPASTTKMALLDATMREMVRRPAIFNLASPVEIPQAVKALRHDLYKLPLQPGKSFRALDLMVASGSLSCAASTLALTVHLGRFHKGETENDRIDSAIARMNELARGHGMVDTNFRNTTGAPDREHFSTAADMSRLSSILSRDFPGTSHQIMGLPVVRTAAAGRQRHHTAPFVRTHPAAVRLIKTGTTNEAGRCYAGVVTAGRQDCAFAIFGGTTAANRETLMTNLFNAASGYTARHTDKTPAKPAPDATERGLAYRTWDLLGLMPR